MKVKRQEERHKNQETRQEYGLDIYFTAEIELKARSSVDDFIEKWDRK